MDNTTPENDNTQSKPKYCTCFTTCFRSSNKNFSYKQMKPTITYYNNININNDNSTVNTVPVNNTTGTSHELTHHPPADSDDIIISQQLDYNQLAGISNTSSPAAGPSQSISKILHKRDNFEPNKDIIQENSNIDQPISLVKDDNWLNRKKENKKTRSSSFGSPQASKNNIVSTTTKLPRTLPHSISLPAPNRMKNSAVHGRDDPIIFGRKNQEKFDPIVGMWIVFLTLVIMLIWGKLCAIICTFAWLFLVPRLRNVMDSRENVEDGLIAGGVDIMSEEYKKKVVLEGLLRRNHRRAVGTL